jgi:hypothetical protein
MTMPDRTAVTLRWDDPEDAAEFLAIRRDLRRQGWLPDSSRDELLALVKDSSEGGDGDG